MCKYSVGLGMIFGAALGILCGILILPNLNLAMTIIGGASAGLLIGSLISNLLSKNAKKESSKL